jgi:hypothetical protein
MAIIEAFTDAVRRPGLAAAVLASVALGMPASSIAGASSFLKSLEGNWRGTGFYRFEGRQTDEKLICRVTNTYNATNQRLDVTGDCATAQLKSSLSGYLMEDGDKISGALMGTLDGSRLTKSTGSIKGNQLVVLANFVDNATGTLYRSQQVVRRTGKGFEADFYWFDNKLGKFAKSGTIKFTGR